MYVCLLIHCFLHQVIQKLPSVVEKVWNKFHPPAMSGLRTQWSWLGSRLASVRTADKRVLINGMDKP